MVDAINQAGIPSDRVEAIWKLDASSHTTANSVGYPFLLRADKGLPLLATLDETQPEYLAQIPRSLPLDLSDLNAWRFALREALTTAFECGYRAVDFTDDNAYLLCRS